MKNVLKSAAIVLALAVSGSAWAGYVKDFGGITAPDSVVLSNSFNEAGAHVDTYQFDLLNNAGAGGLIFEWDNARNGGIDLWDIALISEDSGSFIDGDWGTIFGVTGFAFEGLTSGAYSLLLTWLVDGDFVRNQAVGYEGFMIFTPSTPVPEPGTLALLGLGLMGLGLARRRAKA